MKTRSLLVALVTFGCHHQAVAPAPASLTNVRKTDASGVVDDPLAFLPLDSDAVFGADLDRLRASQAWHEQLEPLLKQGVAGAANDISRKCGYDLTTQIQRISVAFNELDSLGKDTTLVIHGIDAQKLECAVTASGQNVRHDGSVVLASANAGTQIAAMAVSPDTVLVNIAPNASRASLESRVRSGAPLRKDQTFMASFGRLESEPSGWAVINPSLEAFFGPEDYGEGLTSTGIDMTFTATDRYVLIARLGAVTADDAAQWAQRGKALSARSQGSVQKMEVKQDGTIVRFEVLMSRQQTQSILLTLAVAFGLI